MFFFNVKHIVWRFALSELPLLENFLYGVCFVEDARSARTDSRGILIFKPRNFI